MKRKNEKRRRNGFDWHSKKDVKNESNPYVTDPNLQGLDRIYNYISQSATYPFVLYNLLALTWFTGGYTVISISFTNAKPGE